jgi:putative membrane protein
MKSFFRQTILNGFSLFIVSGIYPGLIISLDLLDLFWASAIFTLINLLVKPIIKLFLLPVNLITLGLFRWIANVIVLFILTRLVTNLQIVSFSTAQLSRGGFIIPSLQLTFIFSLIITSFLLSFVFNLLNWIL